MPLKLLSLCAGVGAFELGLVVARLDEAIAPAAFVEINPYCQQILAKHFPNTPIYSDIKTFNGSVGEFDLICCGFPCPPFSVAGKRRGSYDERYLWDEIVRIIKQVKPKGILLENVRGLLSCDSGRIFAGILQDLSCCGYDAEWSVVSAASVGAVHKRERVFVIAYPSGSGCDNGTDIGQERHLQIDEQWNYKATSKNWQQLFAQSGTLGEVSPHSRSQRRHTSRGEEPQGRADTSPNAGSITVETRQPQTQPHVRRWADGLSEKLDRALVTFDNLDEWIAIASDDEDKPLRKQQLMALGNAIVPQSCAIAWKRLYDRLFLSGNITALPEIERAATNLTVN